MDVKIGVESRQFEAAISDIAKREQRLAETVTRLPSDEETYRQLPLEERLLTAASILEHHTTEPFEVELEGSNIQALCSVEHQPRETVSDYGDTTTLKRSESIEVKLHLASSLDERIRDSLRLGVVPFDYQWQGDEQSERERVKRVGRMEYDHQSGRMQLEDTAEQQDQALISVIDEACCRVIEGKLAQQRQKLGELSIGAEVNS